MMTLILPAPVLKELRALPELLVYSTNLRYPGRTFCDLRIPIPCILARVD